MLTATPHYDYKRLIDVYIQSLPPHIHPDFENYYRGLCEALENRFGLKLSHQGCDTALWMLFDATIRSFLGITTPFGFFLEESLVVTRLQQKGEMGEAVFDANKKVIDASKASSAAHKEMLHALFIAMFGPNETIVTSEQLLEDGFDDSRKPDISDYYDLL